nr:alpha-glucosides permease mph3 [Quercus suber]
MNTQFIADHQTEGHATSGGAILSNPPPSTAPFHQQHPPSRFRPCLLSPREILNLRELLKHDRQATTISTLSALARSRLLPQPGASTAVASFHTFMTSLPTSYTPLESLLLFHTLRVEGVTSPSFSRISDQLKSVPLIRSDPSYDADRLGPDALRQLYLDLLKDEVKHDLQRQLDNDPPLANGDSSLTSRKRKAASPTLPSIHEAAQHSHLIPQLVARLYTRYREITVEEIREYERRHVSLSRQVRELEVGNGNGALQKQGTASVELGELPSTVTQPPSGNDISQHDPARPASPRSNGVASAHLPDSVTIKRYSPAKIANVVSHSPEPQQSPSVDRHQPSPVATLPPSNVAPRSPRPERPPEKSVPVSIPHLVQGNSVSYAASSLHSPQASYVSHPGLTSVASPQIQNSLPQPSSSPRSGVPIPTAMQVPKSPAKHTESPDMRGSSGPVPVSLHDQFQHAQRGGMVSSPNKETVSYSYHQPSPAGLHQPQNLNHPERRTSFQAQQSLPPGPYTPQSHPSHPGGYQLQPFYFDAKHQGPLPSKQQLVMQQQQHHHQGPHQIQSSAYPQNLHGYPHYPLAPATGPRPPPQPNGRLISDIVAALATPPRNTQRRPLWKSERRPVPIRIPNVPERPDVEPLSPTISRKSPIRSARFIKNPKSEDSDAHEPDVAPRAEPVSTVGSLSVPTPVPEPKKGRRRQARHKSPHSVVSSVADRSTRARTRSESVSTVAGAPLQSDREPASRNLVKNEPSTPMDSAGDTEALPEAAATPTGRMTRQRRGTLQSQPSQSTARRRRPSRAAADDEAEEFTTSPPRATTITAYRGFDRTSATLVENISGHKHAVYFQGAVRNKNAQGYSEIIKQPQHLRGIKSALSAGKRAVAAAASAESGNVLELERSLDIMPPKAIVNAIQLEKEVMRTMANAAMFNPGEDGLVSDTREMFEDVEAMFADWRGAEQDTAGGGAGVGAGGGDEEEGRGKRRKLSRHLVTPPLVAEARAWPCRSSAGETLIPTPQSFGRRSFPMQLVLGGRFPRTGEPRYSKGREGKDPVANMPGSLASDSSGERTTRSSIHEPPQRLVSRSTAPPSPGPPHVLVAWSASRLVGPTSSPIARLRELSARLGTGRRQRPDAMASRQRSVDMARNATHDQAKDYVEQHGGPLHFPAHDDLKQSDAMAETILNARAATEKEHNMTLMQGVRLYPKAIFWSLLISTCIAMEGYDVCLVNNFYGFTPFNQKYGVPDAQGQYQVPAEWQAGLSNGANVGEIIGLFINGWVSERFGYRYTLMTCLALIAVFTTIFFTAQNVQTLLVGEILCGIPWGIFQTLTITYASEVCPVALRGYLTTYVNFCWGLGQLIGIGVIKSMSSRTDQWAYRIPYALQWMWIPWLFIGIALAPDSPWYLVRKGRTEEAKKNLLRLTSLNRETDFDADEVIAMMVHTTALEEKITSGASYLDCFKGTDLRRTEIVCMCWAIQNLAGNSFSNYSTYFLEQAGVSEANAYSFAMGQYAINMVGVFGAWALMTWGAGRRTLYFYGLCGLCAMLFIMGFLGLVPAGQKQAAGLATGSIMIVWALFYQLTVGTVCYSLVAELSTRRLQIKTVVLGRNLYNIVGIITSVRKSPASSPFPNLPPLFHIPGKHLPLTLSLHAHSHTLYAQPHRLELGQLHRLLLGRPVFRLHRVLLLLTPFRRKAASPNPAAAPSPSSTCSSSAASPPAASRKRPSTSSTPPSPAASCTSTARSSSSASRRSCTRRNSTLASDGGQAASCGGLFHVRRGVKRCQGRCVLQFFSGGFFFLSFCPSQSRTMEARVVRGGRDRCTYVCM